MRRSGSLLILVCIPLSLLAAWVSFPLGFPIKGISLPLLGRWHPDCGLVLLSYGSAVSVLFLVAAVARWRDSFGQLYWAALGILLLLTAAMLKVAYGDPMLLRRLADEADWQQAAQQFTLRYLPSNRGSEYVVWKTLLLDSVEQRLIAGWYFMGYGWYATLIAAIAAWFVALSGTKAASRVWRVAFTGGSLIVIFALFMIRPIASQYAITVGAFAEARGDDQRALDRYLQAIALDPWNALRIDFNARVGVVRANLGETNTAEYRIYRAEALLDQGRTNDAVHEYEQLQSSGGALAALAQSRAAAIWTSFGLELYATGSFGSAVQAWQSALAQVPSDWLAAFLLTRGYFATGRYVQAAELAQQLLKARDPIFVANLYCNLGDAYTRVGALGHGHTAYRLSYFRDFIYNRRGIASLVGP